MAHIRWISSTLQSYAEDGRPAHGYLGPDGRTTALSRAELLASVRRSAGGLIAAGLGPGDRVALVAGDPGPFISAFLGAVWAGLVPVPMAPPPPLGRCDLWRAALDEGLKVAEPKVVVAAEAELPLLSGASAHPLSYGALAAAEEPGPEDPVRFRADRIMYLQFSSGSTGRPRAVAATAGSVAANAAAAMRHVLTPDTDDHAVSWLPLHHDLGLVGFVLAPLATGTPTTYLPPKAFIRDPGIWMRTMSQVKGTITFAPNFAFGLAARHARPEQLSGLDLSRVRVLGCGGEPVNPATLHRFTGAYATAGLDPSTLLPCYGLAESTVAVTFAPRGSGARSDKVSRAALREAGRAVAAADGEDHLEVVNCGRPIPGHEVAVVDATGVRCPDRSVGEIWVRGPSVAAGYVADAEATARTFQQDGWLRTGDRGYLADGELRVTGRLKDLLVVNGRNTDPSCVEWLVEELDGVRPGGVVAFTRPGQDTEQVVVVAECRPDAVPGLERAVRSLVGERLALSVSEVVAAGPGTILRTTSGKPRRQELRRRYLAGQLTATARPTEMRATP